MLFIIAERIQMRILKLSNNERDGARSLLARSANTNLTDLFDSLGIITKDFKEEFPRCRCAYNIIREGTVPIYDEFDYDKLDELIANMLFESFYTIDSFNELYVDVGFGNVQTCYHLINCNNADENCKVILKSDAHLIVIACNGVLRLLTFAEFISLHDADMKIFLDEDQKI